jgi:Mce-associated membrane protein
MPSGKRQRTREPESDESTDAPEESAEAQEQAPGPAEVMETTADVPAAQDEPVDEEETTGSAVAADTTPKRSRRWESLRRLKAGETATAEAGLTDEAATEAEPMQAEPVLVPHRPAGKRLKIAAAAAAVLFVAGGAFIGATAQPVIANRALVETKLDIARTAANAITTLWSYTPDNMDSLAERSARYLTGYFAVQYRKFIDSIVATNKQAQVTNTTSVLGTAVESVSQSEASAIVYTNSVATSPVSKNIPSLRYLSYRLEMKRDRSDWRITRMTTVTSLDLTPQL